MGAASVKTSGIVRKIARHKAAIAKHRDAIRDLIADAEAVAETCDEAVYALEAAADALSCYL